MNRILLAMAFLPTGLVKATGQRFTLLPVDTPVGFFFEAMYRTGPFWRFIGVVQVASAVMLLIPGTALLDAPPQLRHLRAHPDAPEPGALARAHACAKVARGQRPPARGGYVG